MICNATQGTTYNEAIHNTHVNKQQFCLIIILTCFLFEGNIFIGIKLFILNN